MASCPKRWGSLQAVIYCAHQSFPRHISMVCLVTRKKSHPLVPNGWMLAELRYSLDKNFTDGFEYHLIAARVSDNVLSACVGDEIRVNQELTRD